MDLAPDDFIIGWTSYGSSQRRPPKMSSPLPPRRERARQSPRCILIGAALHKPEHQFTVPQ